jgi:hypothetical protein
MTTKPTFKSITIFKATAFAPLMAALLILFCSLINPIRPDMEYALVANESFKNMPKFEIDLFRGSQDFSKANDLIWLSVTPTSEQALSSGDYTYSPKDANKRSAFKFAGTVKAGENTIAITGGSFKVKIDKQNLSVDYNLMLTDGTKVTGQYNGKYQTADRRQANR